jgi:hypothetical protein
MELRLTAAPVWGIGVWDWLCVTIFACMNPIRCVVTYQCICIVRLTQLNEIRNPVPCTGLRISFIIIIQIHQFFLASSSIHILSYTLFYQIFNILFTILILVLIFYFHVRQGLRNGVDSFSDNSSVYISDIQCLCRMLRLSWCQWLYRSNCIWLRVRI